MSDSTGRTLGMFSLLALGVNGMVGVGIFFAPSAIAAAAPGAWGVSVYLLTAAALLPVAHAYAVLGARFDRDGGPYLWARAAFGDNVAFAVGWLVYVSAVFSAAAVLSGLSGHLAATFELGLVGVRRAVALGVVLLLGAVALAGLRPSAVVWNSVTVLKLIPLLVLGALFVFLQTPEAASDGHLPVEPGAFGRAMLIAVFATQGFEVVPVPAGQAKNGRVAVPVATILALCLVALLYALLHAACLAVLPDVSLSPAPLVDAARALGGPSVGSLVSWGTTVSALGIAFGMVVMTPRYLAVLGRREALGAWLGVEDERRRVPRHALYVTLVLTLVLVLLADLTELFALSSVAVLTQYAVVVASLVSLGWRRLHGLRRRHLWSAPLALGAVVLVGQSASWQELAVAALVVLAGLFVLGVRRRRWS